jgi:hypothetical protein
VCYPSLFGWLLRTVSLALRAFTSAPAPSPEALEDGCLGREALDFVVNAVVGGG